jgi:hypothetical protein
VVLATANGKSTIADNVIVATRAGVEVAGGGTAETVVSTNTIGTNKAGTAKLGSLSYGVRLDGSARSKVASNAIVTNGYDVSVAGTVAATFSSDGYQLEPPSRSRPACPRQRRTGDRQPDRDLPTAPRHGPVRRHQRVVGDHGCWQDNTVAGHSSNEIVVPGTATRLKNRRGDPGAACWVAPSASCPDGRGPSASNATGNQVGWHGPHQR